MAVGELGPGAEVEADPDRAVVGKPTAGRVACSHAICSGENGVPISHFN